MDIEDIFRDFIQRHRSVEIAEVEFKRMIADDPETKTLYKEWCHDQGYTERMGFVEYFNNYLDEDESRYDTLIDFDEL